MTQNLVFTIDKSSNKSYERGYDIGLRSIQNWCNIHNISLFTLKLEENDPVPAVWYKYKIFDILKSRGLLQFTKIAYIDLDMIIHPDCPNFFDESISSNNKLNVVHNFGSLDWIQRGLENYSESLNIKTDINYTKYFNAGFIIFTDTIKEFFDIINIYYKDNLNQINETVNKYRGGNDQTIVNLLANKHNVQLEYLSQKFNLQDLPRREVFRTDGINEPYFWTKYAYIFHFNAIPGNHRELMTGVYNKLWQ